MALRLFRARFLHMSILRKYSPNRRLCMYFQAAIHEKLKKGYLYTLINIDAYG